MKYSLSFLFFLCALYAAGMEYGLHFNSHSSPAAKRTSLEMSDRPFEFTDELSVGFDMCFYGKDKFGQICTLSGNDGTKISLVSSSSEDGYRPAIVINNELHTIPVDFIATADHPVRPIIIIKRHENKVVFVYDKSRYTFPVTLKDMTSATICFGKNDTQESVAPIEIQDVRVYTEKKNTHKWELRKHDGDSSIDDLSGVTAHATNPHWILDDHVAWTNIYELKSSDKIQTAFNTKDNTFYIVSKSWINIFNPQQNTVETIPIKQDGRVMKYSNYLTYDTITDQLLSYNFANKEVARFDFESKSWSSNGSDNEPSYANHAFGSDGRYAYMFGGYGFHLYHNNLFRLDLKTDKFEEFTLQPLPEPRTSVAMSISGNSLYLFGGKGNAVGKQEIPSVEYYDLWEYDTETFSGRKIWKLDSVNHSFLPSSMMYYVPKDSSFYAASTLYGGTMIRISINKPDYKVVSEPIHANMDYRDCVFNLYQSHDKKVYYLVIDKRLDDFSHDYAIYQICYPFGDELLYDNYTPKANSSSNRWIYACIAILILIVIAAVCIQFNKNRHKKQVSKALQPSTNTLQENKQPTDSVSGDITSANQDLKAETDNELVIDIISPSKPSLFRRDKSSISFCGKFEIKNKNGEDITPKFTSRIKDLLIMLILYSEKDEKGVSYQKIDEEIWFDKDEKSAKNNRNVYMRKLRLLLEEIGDIEITYEKGYYLINCNDVFIDYHEAMTRLKKGELSGKQLDETIELLLLGPLLPNTAYLWLDSYKSEYTDQSLTLLHRLLDIEQQRKDSDEALAYRIAETISRHDALSEEALATMCRILYNRRMKGPAKNLYDNFCKEYAKSFGEEYSVPFSQIFKA